MPVRLTLDVIDHDGIEQMHPIIHEVELSEDRERIIDEVEETVLRWGGGAIRTLMTTSLKTLSHKKAQQVRARLGGDLTMNATPLPGRWGNRSPDLPHLCAAHWIENGLEQCDRPVLRPLGRGHIIAPPG